MWSLFCFAFCPPPPPQKKEKKNFKISCIIFKDILPYINFRTVVSGGSVVPTSQIRALQRHWPEDLI
jgi:hypothetical protein